MITKAAWFTSALLAAVLSGCSAPKETAGPGAEILCAAEALKGSRNARSPADQNLLLNRATIFEQKLPPSRHDQAHRTAEGLADRAGTAPLIETAECDALLSPDEKENLRRKQG